jgi:hypothetical protein
MATQPQIITIPLQDGNQTYTPQFALFEMVDGRAVMTPCDANGNPIECEAGE